MNAAIGGILKHRNRFLRGIAALYILVQIGSMALAPWMWLADVANFFRSFLLGIGLVLAVLALLQRSKANVILAVLVAISGVLPLLPRPPQAAQINASEVVTVVTANVNNHFSDPQVFFAQPEVQAADFLVLQETPASWQSAIEQHSQHWPMQASLARSTGFQALILSKLSLQAEARIEPDNRETTRKRDLLRAVFNTKAGPLVIYALHSPSPHDPQKWHQRNNYLQLLEEALAAEPKDARVIVAGDWNTPPWSPFFRALLKRSGYGSTEAQYLPKGTRILREFPDFGVPVDRIILSPSLGYKSLSVGRPFGSDHLFVAAEIVLGR